MQPYPSKALPSKTQLPNMTENCATQEINSSFPERVHQPLELNHLHFKVVIIIRLKYGFGPCKYGSFWF